MIHSIKIFSLVVCLFAANLGYSAYSFIQPENFGPDTVLIQQLIDSARNQNTTYAKLALLEEADSLCLPHLASDDLKKIKSQRGHILRYKSYSLASQGQFDLADKKMQEAIKLFESVDDLLGLSRCYTNMGLIAQLIHPINWELVIKYEKKALKLRQATNIPDLLYGGYNNMGWYHQQMQAYDSARVYYNKGLALAKKQGDLETEARFVNNIGASFFFAGDTAASEKFFYEALELRIKAQDVSGSGETFQYLAWIAIGRKDFETALAHYEGVERIMNDHGNKGPGYFYNEMDKVEALIGLKQTEKALAICEQSIALSEGIGDINTDLYLMKMTSLVYEAQGNFKKSLSLFREYTARRDSIDKGENQTILHEQAVRFETEKQQQLLENERAIRQVERDANETVYWSLAVVAFAVLIIIILLIIGYRNKMKLNNKLKEQNETIGSALAEKGILLREVHHRVKNNLQIISSMLNMQSKHLNNEEAKRALEDGKNRVLAMSFMHDMLLQSGNSATVPTEKYLMQLIQNLKLSYATDDRNLTIDTNLDDLKLDIDSSIIIGLILNELITNSLKHAFSQGEKGTIHVAIQQHEKQLTIIVADNGIGLPADFDADQFRTYGMRLIHSLVVKLEGSIELNNANGTKAIVTVLI